MSNLRKTAVAVIALSSGAVFAGTMGPVCSAVNVTVPCESTAWDVGGKALYFQPSVTAGNGQSTTVSTGGGQTVDLTKGPKWGWGFMVEGSYHFNTGNDLNLNWYHLSTARSGGFNGSRTISSDLGDVFGSVVGANQVTSTTINTAAYRVDPQWDMVNLEFGQHVDFGENKTIRFHGGFEFARVTANNSLNTSGSLTRSSGATPTFSNRTGNNPSYNGFGPRLGADMSYDWGNGLGIYANGAAALLAGTAKYSTTFTSNTRAASLTVSGSDSTVVPELEGKLGINYSYATAQGDLTLDVGWMWINYFNAVKASDSGTIGNNVDTGDFGLQGLYFGLKWLGNVA